MKYGHDLAEERLRCFHDGVIAQNIPVVESQRLELRLPALQTELHLRSDRTGIAYRKWLRQIRLKCGTV